MIEDTVRVLQAVEEYMAEANKVFPGQDHEKHLNFYNQKVVCMLNCYRMRMVGLRQEVTTNRTHIEALKTAAKCAMVKINDFETGCHRHYGEASKAVDRLGDITIYMRRVLREDKVPPTPYIRHNHFNAEVMNRGVRQMIEQMNHGVPDEIAKVRANKDKHGRDHAKMLQRNKPEHWQPSKKRVNTQNLMRDTKGQRVYALTKQQQMDAIRRSQKVDSSPPELDDYYDEDDDHKMSKPTMRGKQKGVSALAFEFDNNREYDY